MKTLYLVRHAKSSWDFPALDDFDRPLNARGERDAPFMANLIAQKIPCPNILVSSPALRAKTTAHIFAQALNYPSDNLVLNAAIYEASVNGLMTIVQCLEDKWQTAMLFGHNMTFTFFANLYAKPMLENVPTCGVVGLEFDINDWSEITNKNGKLVLWEFPKKYSTQK